MDKEIILPNVLYSWNSWLGHAKHANSYKLISKYKNQIKKKEKYGIN